MKIAFIGKGGSGKSTMTALFIRYLQSVKGDNVLAIDADLNMNLAGLLGVKVDGDNVLANPEIQKNLRTYLKGTNSRIANASSFLPTTLPGDGSNLITRVDEAALAPYAVCVSDNPAVSLLTVGAYGKEEIGQACYHTHLFMAENLLSHTRLPVGSHVVCDMVAGTDAFAYSLHLQFDCIVLIAEPTPESAQVCRNYLELAREAGVDSLIHLVANKIEDEDDLDFIRENSGLEPLAVLPVMPMLKKLRQQGSGIEADSMNDVISDAMEKIHVKGLSPAISQPERMTMLTTLHGKLATHGWVKSSYGDVLNQIDADYLRKAG